MKLPELKSMQSLVDKMRTKLEKLEETIEKRNDYFNDKSEKWQESSVGQEYEERTSWLEDNHMEIEAEIETIESSMSILEDLQD